MLKTARPLLFALLTTLAGLAVLAVVEGWEWERVRQAERLDTLNQLSTLRARLEGELNGTLLLARSMSAIVAVRKDVTQQEFDAVAREMMAEKRHIRNVTLAQGTIIRYVYPLEGNQAAIGLDYRNLPQQWPTIERMFALRLPVVSGPVTLVQGGTAIIGRTPIFTTPPGQAPGSGPPWGAVAIPIMLPSLLEAVGLTDPDLPLTVAVRGTDGLGEAGAVFHGDASLFQRDPVVLEVTLPGGRWLMAALPRSGWGARPAAIVQLRALGGGLALLAGIAVFFWVRHADSRRESRRRVAASENRLSAMLAGAPFPLVVLRASDGVVQYANLRAGMLIGLAPPALVGRPLPPHTLAARDLVRMRQILKDEGMVDDYQARLHDVAGRPYWVLVSMIPMREDGAVVVACNDITARKAAEDALQDQLALHQTVIDTIPNALYYRDIGGRHLGCNQAFAELVDKPREEIIGRTLADLGASGALIAASEQSDRDLAEGRAKVQTFDQTIEHPDGRVIEAMIHKAAVRNTHGKVTGVVGVMTDITDRVASEQQLQRAKEAAEAASRAKSEFLAVISHEIRTPMNGILGMAHLLLQSALDAEQKDYVSTLHNSGEALLTILNDILEFSRLESGGVAVEAEPFDLARVLDEAVALMGPRAREKELSLTLDLAPGLPTALVGDAARLRQVLLNLVGNAVKFTDKGGVTVSVFASGPQQGRAILRFDIRDTGVGIPSGAMGRLFQSFSQADSSISRRFGGTGLGLAICKRLVELMGGTIGVESEPGRGSCFWFQLPFGMVADLLPAPQPAEPAALGRPLKLLLAEDNPVNQKVAIALLERMGHRVTAVANGRLAVEAVSRGGFDLVLMDVHMPEMDGFEATRHIRRLAGTIARIPVVAMTANVLAGDEEKCLNAGMDDYLGKPFKPADLAAKLARWAEKLAAA